MDDGPLGGKLIRLKRKGNNWYSRFSSDKADLQGDPRWFIDAVGQKAARYFGFRASENNEDLVVPDLKEFLKAIENVNVELTKRKKEKKKK